MNKNKGGKFIVIEGADGSGKSTLSEGLLKKLPESALFREPTNNSPYSEKLRSILSGKKDAENHDLKSLFMDDRLWDLKENIQPSLSANKYTILDRYYYSTAAYQSKTKEEVDDFININFATPQIRQPDIIFYLKIDFETALKRISLRNKNLEIFEKKHELKRIIENYDYIFTNFLYPSLLFILDAKAKPEEILDLALRKVSLIE